MPTRATLVDRRVLWVSFHAVWLAVVAAFVAQGLTWLIGLITNLSFYGRWSSEFVSPAHHQLGLWVIIVPALGGIVVGLMARYGSQAIRGHGIPEAMEQILTNDSRIPIRMTFLKPLSAAIAIGSGGPFGAEGPIIATGGAMGSVLGQVLKVTPAERKALLAAGAAAGMAAIFNAPIASVLLAIELLLFEFRPRSLIPVSLAVIVSTMCRRLLAGESVVFVAPTIAQPSAGSLIWYLLIGAIVGVASVGITRLVYAIEDGFAHLPIHWMWWPALGGLCVGLIGYGWPDTLGVGYTNIEHMVRADWGLQTVVALMLAKLASWSIALGSGTSGGTLAPLFTIGGCLGAVIGCLLQALVPHAHIHPGVAAMVGMAAMFAGASRAVLTSIVFVFETTGQTGALLPLMGGCMVAYLLSCLSMRTTIMTEKIARRGVKVPDEYAADPLEHILVSEACTHPAHCLDAEETSATAMQWLKGYEAQSHHQNFPVLQGSDRIIGIVSRQTILTAGEATPTQTIGALPMRVAAVIRPRQSLREAIHLLATTAAPCLVVTDPHMPQPGILTRADIVRAQMHHARKATAAPERLWRPSWKNTSDSP
ncbi:MAG TPA: chloride channel protein [Aquabacterium sp.]|nr:chloride channel protein [Aquabacterium sp.]